MQKGKSNYSKYLGRGLTTALVISLLLPQSVFADLNQLQQEERQKQQELDNARKVEQEASRKKQEFQKQINVNAAEINKLAEEINVKEATITKLAGEVTQKGQQIEQTQKELAEAEARIAQRDDIMRQRLVMMYEQGEVQYLEVLLSAKSFTDFLERFDSLKMIYEQDNRILEKNKEDRDLVANKKKQLEEQKSSLLKMKNDQQAQKAELDGMKSQKEVINQQLNANKAEQERIEHEQQAIQQSAIDALYAIERKKQEEAFKNNTKPQEFTGPFTWPVPSSYNITSEFGERIDPFTGQRAGHNGMDVAAPTGTPTVAAQSGTVITAGWVSGFGNCVIIDHGGGLWSLYGHLSSIGVAQGTQVTKGDVVGKIGSTGRSTGPHLHFGVYLNGKIVNPRNYL